MLNFIKHIIKNLIFWLLLFAIFRFIFIVYNISYSDGATKAILSKSFLVGLHLDLSMTGYILMLTIFIQAIVVLMFKQLKYVISNWINYIFIIILIPLLLSNIHLYSYWGRLLDVEGFSFLKTPWVIFASIKWYESFLFFILWGVLSWFFIRLFNFISKKRIVEQKLNWLTTFSVWFLLLLFAGLMIIPIRGGFGVAPINTGKAFFSSNNFANHSAVNPIWNLLYSFKRSAARTHHYKFMSDEKACDIFEEMTFFTNDSTQKVLKDEKPNVVIILLESFSSQVVGCVGGVEATPNLDSIAKEGILFSNIYAASDRSDKGIVATMAGYQVMPGYSIIQYPEKSQSLNFMPKKLKENDYSNLTYLYGGDMGFKGMNSFVTLSGFEKVVSIGSFPSSLRNTKWGVHDEYTFDRLVSEMEESQKSGSPFFHFFFTLSSHEPFDVPYKSEFTNPYINSVAYTDSCLGDFFTKVKEKNLWDNTLFVLIADHGTPGPKKANSQMAERYQIPMIWTGGAMAVQDSIVEKLGSQRDMISTLLYQLDIENSDFKFSKNILSPNSEEFAFFTYNDAFGYITPHSYQVYDNVAKQFINENGYPTLQDSLRGQAYLQVVSADHLKR